MVDQFPMYSSGTQGPLITAWDYKGNEEYQMWGQVQAQNIQPYQAYQRYPYEAQHQYAQTIVPGLSFPVSACTTIPTHHEGPFELMSSSNMTDTAVLARPLTFPFSGKTANNRIMKSAMSERLATFSPYNPRERGQPTEELKRLYETWATGGIGIIVTGNIQIKKGHLEATGNAIIDRDIPSDYVEDYRALARAAKTRGSLVLGQLSHPGRQVPITVQPCPESASDIEHPSIASVWFARPTPLTKEGIRDIVQRFAYAAFVLHEAGFDGIQLHAAHGYLLHQFLSLRTNKRTDGYGGPLANRSRLLLEIISEIKCVVNDPTFMLSVKFNCQDFLHPDGVTEEESIALAQMLEGAGVDLLEVSGGTYESVPFRENSEYQDITPSQRHLREAYFIDFADRLRPHVSLSKICVTGGFRSAHAMADAVRGGSTDVVGLARPLAAEPFLVLEMLRGDKPRAKEDKLPLGQTLSIAAAATQIAEIGNGYDITDFSNTFNVSRFVAKLQKEIPAVMSEALVIRAAKSPEGSGYGYNT